MDNEPQIHSHNTDVLPDGHPWAWEDVFCEHSSAHGQYGEFLHAANNECMTTWVEWGGHALCGDCFAHCVLASEGVLEFEEFEKLCEKPAVKRLVMTQEAGQK